MKKFKFRLAIGLGLLAWYALKWALGEKDALKFQKDIYKIGLDTKKKGVSKE